MFFAAFRQKAVIHPVQACFDPSDRVTSVVSSLFAATILEMVHAARLARLATATICTLTRQQPPNIILRAFWAHLPLFVCLPGTESPERLVG